ncbi:hypothetical protein L2E82_45572 [Cichorium intybus]|uniref:Uncharacterized protein n=1 Tax=Cichorium intybus TaxID=13427 RepID=A0ACB8ZUC6_CICIN|nr:hypothetical protein L2E82_45572 [Cichorium intybus]
MQKEEQCMEDLKKRSRMERRVTRSQSKVLQRDPMSDTISEGNWGKNDLRLDFEKSDLRMEEVGSSCGFVKGEGRRKGKASSSLAKMESSTK